MSNTDEQHSDYHNLQQCLPQIIGLNKQLNDKMKEFSERAIVRKIANCIKGNASFQLETPNRKFIKNGILSYCIRTVLSQLIQNIFKRISHQNG